MPIDTIHKYTAKERTKSCLRCHRLKPLSAFYRHPEGGKESHHAECRRCTAKMLAGPRRRFGAPPPGYLRCKICRGTKPLEDFPPDSRAATGCSRRCRTCHVALSGDVLSPEAEDSLVKRTRRLREHRISLGIAVAHATCPPGHCRTTEELAAYAGITDEAMRRLELIALRKMRRRALEILRAAGLSLKGGCQ